MSEHHKEDFRLHTPDFEKLNNHLDRRNFLIKTSLGIGALATGSLLGLNLFGNTTKPLTENNAASFEEEMLRAIPHFAPKAKRIVYLFMAGGPSQFETFDYKPGLVDMMGKGLAGFQ